jgi:hypothetical protein
VVIMEQIFLLTVFLGSVYCTIVSYSYPVIAGYLPRFILFILMPLILLRMILLMIKNKRSSKESVVESTKSATLEKPTKRADSSSGFDTKMSRISFNKNLIIGFAMVLAFVLAIQVLGFYVSVVLIVFFGPQFLGLKQFKPRLFSTVSIVFFIYLIFGILLHSEFPKGLIGLM